MKKSTRWSLIATGVAATGATMVLAFLLAVTGEGRLYERHVVWLFWVNVAVAALLLLAVGIAAVRLGLRWRRGKFGSVLLAKLAGIFVIVGVIPGVLIYTVSVQFVTRSIENWFDAQVAGALDAGLTLGRTTLEAFSSEVAAKARGGAERLGDARAPASPLVLERLREQMGVADVAIVGAGGQVLAAVGGSASAIAPERPAASLLRQARNQRLASQIEGLDDEVPVGQRPSARVRALALLPSSEVALTTGNEARYLMVVQPLPGPLVANALAVQAAYSEYQKRALARDGLKRMYIGTLTLALVLTVFGAVLLAAVFGNQIARPLLLLADGVRQVAAGDLTAKPVFASRDELGGLTRDFAQMTEQLAEARAQVQRGVAQLEGARTRLQTILDSLSAGVIVFDRNGCIDTVNPGATRILRQPMSAYRGRELAQVPGLADFAAAVAQRFELHRTSPEAGERDHWQDAFALPQGDSGNLDLLVRGAALPRGASLMVFDDITEVVSAQRSVAWAEVARRLAHEIKNPLTPIQLSAERLQHKLEAKLEGADQAMLVRSVGTIVAQVQAMKQLVDEFRDYARLPAAKLAPLDLNALVTEVLALYGAAKEQGRLAVALLPDLPAIEGDGSQLRQVIHNLVQNGLDAVAERADGRVLLRTEVARNDDGEPRAVRLVISDNGPGFADKVLKRAFEPYVTTKARGTGLGLAVVKKIADEHGARLRLANLHGEGPGVGLDGDAAQAAVSGAQVSLSFSRFARAAGAS